MQMLTIAWTLICAGIIIGYPIYLFNRTSSISNNNGQNSRPLSSNTVELLSFDIRNQLPGWSFTIDVPEITEDVLYNSPILFYLESEEACLKLPFNNATLGYSANVYKNVGKVYVTFKSLNDGVSNFYIPSWHLSKLKILIIKSRDKRIYGDWGAKPNKSPIHKGLLKAGININDYEDILGYFSNIAAIDFKGHFVAPMPKRYKRIQPTPQDEDHKLYSTA
ncbi:hypothetical protein [Flagellimonas iocasae]|uniref:Uncharacterized protein n=1 Tax=Flagellimonas iocasae TaxID=2055905 RepID=A0ABW4Y399_9FLAO